MSYLLGHAEDEWARLDAQHQLWRDTLLEHLDLHAHERVLEVGCGNGALLADLADRAQATGLERDADAAARARARTGVEVVEGDLREVPLPEGLDVIVARWVFSFLPDPDAAVARLVTALRPGGRLIIQDYNHEGLSIFPRHPAVDRVVHAVREDYRSSGGDVWVAGRLPAAMHRAGLEVTGIHPAAKAGPPDSPTWQWVERFLLGRLPHLVPKHLTSEQAEAFREAWFELRTLPGATLFSPLQVTVVGRKPDGA